MRVGRGKRAMAGCTANGAKRGGELRPRGKLPFLSSHLFVGASNDKVIAGAKVGQRARVIVQDDLFVDLSNDKGIRK